jgi:acetyltransferase-like isoleucine patch superfamily enzyme
MFNKLVYVYGNVIVGSYTLIGAGAIILPNITIGRNLVIKAGSVIKKNVFTNEELTNHYNKQNKIIEK